MNMKKSLLGKNKYGKIVFVLSVIVTIFTINVFTFPASTLESTCEGDACISEGTTSIAPSLTSDISTYAVNNGVKPIIGAEVYMANRGRFDKDVSGGDAERGHLILLAKNNNGYKNLTKLVSLAFVEGFYYKPRIDKEILENIVAI